MGAVASDLEMLQQLVQRQAGSRKCLFFFFLSKSSKGNAVTHMLRSWVKHGSDATLSNIKQRDGEEQTLKSSIGGYFKGERLRKLETQQSHMKLCNTVLHVPQRLQRGVQTPQ